MSAEPSIQPVETDGLRESLAEICASQEEFCKFFSGVFADLDAISGTLVRKRQAWSIERAEAESELQRRSARLEAERAAIAAEREQAPKLHERLQALERELAERDQERVVLESELDMVRNRAAEMAETLAQHQQQMADERQQWTQELKQMRRLLETLSSHGLEHPAPAEAPRTRVAPPRTAAKPAEEAAAARQGGDPVLGSVMAQFEMLQKDIVRRRKESA